MRLVLVAVREAIVRTKPGSNVSRAPFLPARTASRHKTFVRPEQSLDSPQARTRVLLKRDTMTSTRIFLLSALFFTCAALASGISDEPAFLPIPSLKFSQRLLSSRPSRPLKVRNLAHCDVRAQIPPCEKDEFAVPVQAQAILAAVAVQDHPDLSSLLAVGLFTSACILFNGAGKSSRHALHANICY